MASHPRRIEARLAILRRRVMTWYLRGLSQAEIAVKIGQAQQTVSRHIEAELSRIRAKNEREVTRQMDEELERISRLERVYQRAWERSCKDAEVLHAGTTKGRTTKDGHPLPDLVKTHKTVRGQAGDAEFLRGLERCIEMRMRVTASLIFDKRLKGLEEGTPGVASATPLGDDA